MSAKSTRKDAVRFGLEAVYGVDALPTAGVLCGDISITPLDGSVVERRVQAPYFGSLGNFRVESFAKVSFATELSGSGVAGTAPLVGPLLKCCNFTETVTAAAITGTAQAGGSTTTIKLAAGASSVDDFYNGMSINVTGGLGSGQAGEIIDYVGSTRLATVARAWATAPDATSTYSIGANTLYTPNSHFDGSPNTSGTLYFYKDGLLHVLLGARGNVKPSLNSGEISSLMFEFTGLMGTISDTPFPTLDLSAWPVPITVSTENTDLQNLMGYTAAVWERLNFDVGNQVQYKQRIGSESVRITDRKVTGEVSIEMVSVATWDVFGISKANSYGALCVKHGTTAGSIVGITAPRVQLNSPNYEDSSGTVMVKANLALSPLVGNDDLRICFK